MKKKNKPSTWTRFMDMHSGGGTKEKWQYIYIEAPESEAKVIFYNRFGHNPDRVSCTCCGNDYIISEGPLDQITAYERGCAYSNEDKCWIEAPDAARTWGSGYCTIEQYQADPEVLFIPASTSSSKSVRVNCHNKAMCGWTKLYDPTTPFCP
jgi:hypothetical protein